MRVSITDDRRIKIKKRKNKRWMKKQKSNFKKKKKQCRNVEVNSRHLYM